jgi:hypothetical protein
MLNIITAAWDAVGVDWTVAREGYYVNMRKLAAIIEREVVFNDWDRIVELTVEQLRRADEMRSRVMWIGRSLCTTESGLFANVMNVAAQGDVFVALQGGSDRLYALRPVGDSFRLVGDAWVDGWMEGQAYRGLDPAEVDIDLQII